MHSSWPDSLPPSSLLPDKKCLREGCDYPAENGNYCTHFCEAIDTDVSDTTPLPPPPPLPAELKPTNPKDAIGSDKLPVHLWPETATALGCLGLLDGVLKYGRSNFRAIGVRASIYVDACRCHLNRWFEGEDMDPDSGLPHFAHALACLAILVDADAAGMLNDDRQFPGGYIEYLQELTPHVRRLKGLHAGKTPRHYTIADDPQMVLRLLTGGEGRPR